ncbi:oxygen-independent coproporphyrinogen-3 oxidase [Tangfeifania diversioriginum]|uniref:Heme chaperone HemW n=1 Tax=Tangfeifania diversioriginum TaxID=1168035 RepID=A0A1M6FAP1_9BACT|nr:radical SAM family heme chaperone HemW [Tangfeifania diversioriginum]SHI94711.1 oxygen-independent coproporphyrinogen-3 oxidase [Tangfeifania diversioriginum]
MAGIYIHIPFCRQKCYYCNFYKTVNQNFTSIFLNALANEIVSGKYFLSSEPVETIYFGGGTPSVLTENELVEILNLLHKEFTVTSDAEITFEANPDDLNPAYLNSLFSSGVNRLSIGIQSFNDEHLKKMNRRHTAKQAVNSVGNAVKAGFNNISIDLIYGLPGLTSQQWKQNLDDAFQLPAEHLSAYHLTYHEGTPFYTWLKKGTLTELSEDKSVEQFNILLDSCLDAGFEQYEISNFTRDKKYSKHNTAYWTGGKYLGLGPSAHSFDGEKRRWNVAHVEAYCNAIENKTSYFQEEQLSENDKFNEYILTNIRTKWGLSQETISERFGKSRADFFTREIEKYIQNKKITEQNGIFTLTRAGLFVSDDIMANLMII